MEQNKAFTPYFDRQYLQRTLCRGTKISDTRCSYDVLIFNFGWSSIWLSHCPIHPKFITSFNRDTPQLVVRLHHFEKLRQVPECRCGSTGCIIVRWVCKVENGGHWWDGYMGDGVYTWGLLGMGEAGVGFVDDGG